MSRRDAACGLGLALLALGVYARALGNGFVAYDDPLYVVENPAVTGGLRWSGVVAAFTGFHAANWHPLTWLSHMLDVELFGLGARGHHASSVALHALNAALFFLALRSLTLGPRPALVVAALFALHPLRVESVAWISERKDVLSGTFFCAALWCHAALARDPSARRRAGLWTVAALGLMAKPMLVTLPVVLLLLDFWPLGRWRAGVRARLVAEKLPLVLLALASCALTIASQRAGGAVRALETLGLRERALNAAWSYAAYLGQAVWPAELTCFHPHPALVAPEVLAPRALFGAALLVVLTLCAWLAQRRAPYLLVGWLWYLVMLLPVIGLVQVGVQALAERYAYLALIGPQLAVVMAARAALSRWPAPAGAAVGGALALAVLGACAVRTWIRIGDWRDSQALFTSAIAVDAENYLAHVNLGTVLAKEGRHAEAVQHFEAALAVHPRHAEAHNNLGTSQFALGRQGAAREHFAAAVALAPSYAEAHYNLGLCAAQAEDWELAVREFERALALRPDLEPARASLELARRRWRGP